MTTVSGSSYGSGMRCALAISVPNRRGEGRCNRSGTLLQIGIWHGLCTMQELCQVGEEGELARKLLGARSVPNNFFGENFENFFRILGKSPYRKRGLCSKNTTQLFQPTFGYY